MHLGHQALPGHPSMAGPVSLNMSQAHQTPGCMHIAAILQRLSNHQKPQMAKLLFPIVCTVFQEGWKGQECVWVMTELFMGS